MKTLFLSLMLCTAIPFSAGTSVAQSKDPTTLKLKGLMVCSKCYLEADPNEKPYGSEDDILVRLVAQKAASPQPWPLRAKRGQPSISWRRKSPKQIG